MSIGLFAQQTEPDNHDGKFADNEIRLNILYLIAKFPELTYERNLSDESSVGLSVAFSLDDDIDFDYIISPFYRLYFGKKRAAGFFIEGNGSVFSEEVRSRTEIAAGLGIGVGGKFLTKRNWTGELLLGLGSTLINTDKTSGAYPRVGISIGKRF